MLLAHAAAVAAFRARPDSAGAEIGVVLCGDWGEPLRGGRDTAPAGLALDADGARADAAASELFHEFEFGWFLDPIVRLSPRARTERERARACAESARAESARASPPPALSRAKLTRPFPLGPSPPSPPSPPPPCSLASPPSPPPPARAR